MTPILQFSKVSYLATLPSKAHTGPFEDAAYDLYSASEFGTTIYPGTWVLVPTGLKCILPEGYWVKFHERSGLSAKNAIQVLAGVIDTAYTGEWKVVLYNASQDVVVIDRQKAIAQFTLERLNRADIQCISEEDFDAMQVARERGSKGFGSSDK